MNGYVREWSEVDRLVGAFWRISSPAALLLNAWVAYHYHGAQLHSEQVAINDVNSDAAARLRDEAYVAWLKPRLAVHEGFIALRAHYAAMGLRGEFVGHDGYGGDATNWGVIVPRDSLPILETLAQDAVGLITPEDREAAARDFRIYMARNYDRNYLENRRTMPAVDQSPYRRAVE